MKDINLIKIQDPCYNVYLDTSLKSINLFKLNKIVIGNFQEEKVQVFRDMWHPILEKDYIQKCIKEELKTSNWVSRVLYNVKTITPKGWIEEGIIPIPKYVPFAFKTKTSNPRIHFLYKVQNNNLFYFK